MSSFCFFVIFCGNNETGPEGKQLTAEQTGTYVPVINDAQNTITPKV